MNALPPLRGLPETSMVRRRQYLIRGEQYPIMSTLFMARSLQILVMASAALAGYLFQIFPLGALAASLVAVFSLLILFLKPCAGTRSSASGTVPDAGNLLEPLDPLDDRSAEGVASSTLDLAKALELAEASRREAGSLAIGVSQAVARTPYLRALLRLVTDKSEAAVFDLMERFTSVSDELGTVLSRAEAVRSKVDGSAESSVSVVVAEARAASSAEAEVMRTFINGSKDTAKSTERMRELVEGSMEMLRDIEDVSERSRLIAFNLAVEAARIGSQGQGIKVIVNELSNINDKIISFSKAVALRLKENRDLGVMIADRLGKETGILADKVEDGRVASERSLEHLISTTKSVVELLDTMTASFSAARQSMDGMLTSMQFQDITRQQVETVEWAVTDTSNVLGKLIEATGYEQSADKDGIEEFRRRLLQQAKVEDEKALILEVKA
jgi:methyl-accepting chemotaxis protein